MLFAKPRLAHRSRLAKVFVPTASLKLIFPNVTKVALALWLRLIGIPFCHRKFASGRCTEAAAANLCPRPVQRRRSPNRKKRIPLVIRRDLATKNYFCTPENQLQRTTRNISEIRGLVLTMRSDWCLISQCSGRFHLRNYLIWTNETRVRFPSPAGQRRFSEEILFSTILPAPFKHLEMAQRKENPTPPPPEPPPQGPAGH